MTQTITQKSRLKVRCNWLFGCQADLLVFFLPLLLVTVPVFFSNTSSLLTATICAVVIGELIPVIGTAHAGATWFHFFDKKNRDYYLGSPKNLFIFVIAPALIMLTAILLFSFHEHRLAKMIFVIWTMQHLTQQNIGILLLYRNQNSGEAAIPRKLEALTLQIPTVLFGSLFVLQWYISPPIFIVLVEICVCVTLVLCRIYIGKLFQQARDGAIINPAAVVFWLISVWFFLPLAFSGYNIDRAMLIPLFVHYCQYLGLNYLLVKRKYEGENGANLPLHQPVIFFVLFCAIFGLIFHRIDVTFLPGFWDPLFRGLVLGYALIHYFQDAFIWRFREQFQRESILPFLKPQRQAISAGAVRESSV